MHNASVLVNEFNCEVLKIERRDRSLLSQDELDITLKSLREEIDELEEAHRNGDFIGCIDAIHDLIYFALGALYKKGLTPHENRLIFEAIHEANMQKKLGVNFRRGDGSAADAVKPADWVPPEERIAAILGGAL